MYIVSAGKAFNDIDAFGCAIAYAELLRKEGKDAQAVFIGPLNHSITPLAYEQKCVYLTNYTLKPEDALVYVDLSGPKHFAFPDEDESRIFEIYDHHYGFEDYWKERLGDRAHIERVGAAATLIWEEFQKRGFDREISSSSANVLALAILQNTLNFTSSETNARDIDAFQDLCRHVTMADEWQQRYFVECSSGMREHFEDTLRNDTKIIEHLFEGRMLIFSQLEISEDPIALLDLYKQVIDAYWAEFPQQRYLINIADMVSKTSLLYSNDLVWLREELAPLFSEAEIGTHWIRVPIHQRKQILNLLQA